MFLCFVFGSLHLRGIRMFTKDFLEPFIDVVGSFKLPFYLMLIKSI